MPRPDNAVEFAEFGTDEIFNRAGRNGLADNNRPTFYLDGEPIYIEVNEEKVYLEVS